MVEMVKQAGLEHIPFGVVEVRYPPRAQWRTEDFHALAEAELAACRQRYPDYDRKAAFGENPYVRFFKKFKKTYPVVLQFESVICKGLPFPEDNPVTAVPFLLELTTLVLSGTHDVERLQGPVSLYLATEKEPFQGRGERELHTYPGDFCARDGGGIIFSTIAGTDGRTCARPESRHVFYPVFGTPDLPGEVIRAAMETLERFVGVLAPGAQVETALL